MFYFSIFFLLTKYETYENGIILLVSDLWIPKISKCAFFRVAHNRCTRAGLKQITCPSGLSFDVEKQTCDWKAKVTNCDKKESKSQTTIEKRFWIKFWRW